MGDISIKTVLFKAKKYKNDESPIMIRLTMNRESVYLSTNFTAIPSQWNESKCCLWEAIPRISKGKDIDKTKIKALKEKNKGIEINPSCKKINSDLRKITGDVQKLIDKHKILDEYVTLKAIKEGYNSRGEVKEVKGFDFIKYAIQLRDSLQKLGQYRTYKRYKTIIDKLIRYRGEGVGLMFIEITTDFLKQYEAHLKGLNNKPNTIHNNLKTIRAIYYQGIKDKKIDQVNNPFFSYKLKVEATKKVKLTLDELTKIKNFELQKDSFLNHARNSFIFSYYNAGIRIGDLMLLKWDNISNEGRLVYTMKKQGSQASIKLREESLKILEQYKPKKSNKNAYIFPFISNELDLDTNNISEIIGKEIENNTSKINQALKKITDLLGIDKKVTTHIARHTFADIARTKDVSIYDISKALKHSSIKQTEIYLAGLDEDSLDHAMDKVHS